MHFRLSKTARGRRLLVSAAGIVMLASLTAGSAAVKDAPPLEPSGPWAIDYGEQSCRLIRDFSDGTERITLAFERFAPGPQIRLGVAGLKLLHPDTTIARIRYGAQAQSQTSDVYESWLADGRDSFLLWSAPLLVEPLPKFSDKAGRNPFRPSDDPELAVAAAIDRLQFIEGVSGDPVIELGPMEEPIRALQACTADLMKHWNIDPQRLRTMSRQATPAKSPSLWLTADDLRGSQLRQYKPAQLNLRLIVDEHGKVAACYTDLDVPDEFGQATCAAIVRRARFEPALDADGKPMRTIWVSSVRYQE
uniref:hypothetical protein n=1 Tax=Altererythrobacter segetis TaxID=1104773 RepID=UPI00140E89E1|nr:hypothetical protein [Altererythrobacter segetis]